MPSNVYQSAVFVAFASVPVVGLVLSTVSPIASAGSWFAAPPPLPPAPPLPPLPPPLDEELMGWPDDELLLLVVLLPPALVVGLPPLLLPQPTSPTPAMAMPMPTNDSEK
jgi:hypothetical protein